MIENNEKKLDEKFPPNRKTERVVAEPLTPEETKKVEKVINGKVVRRKRGFGKKLVDIFVEGTVDEVKNRTVHDVLIPAAKKAICDIFGWGGFVDMIVNGRLNNPSNLKNNGGRYTNYGASYKQTTSIREENKRDISRTNRARLNLDEIILETRGEAEEILSILIELVDQYGMATVADLYDRVGIVSDFTDNKWGWVDLRSSSVARVRDGYLINLPRPQPLD